MKNPIPHYPMFVTESIADVFARITTAYNGTERALALQVAMMVLNACHKEVEDHLREELDI